MPDGDVEINLVELEAHQKRLGGVLDHVTAASDAAYHSTNPQAFGELGTLLAEMCTDLQAECGDHIRSAAATTTEHITKVGEWHDSVSRHEEYRARSFEEGTDLD
jgi:hypothetical protein